MELIASYTFQHFIDDFWVVPEWNRPHTADDTELRESHVKCHWNRYGIFNCQVSQGSVVTHLRETLYSGTYKISRRMRHWKILKIGFTHLRKLRPSQENLTQGRTGNFSLISLVKASQPPIVTCILTAIIDLLTLAYKPDLHWKGEPPRRIYRSRVISFQSNRTTHTHTHTHTPVSYTHLTLPTIYSV